MSFLVNSYLYNVTPAEFSGYTSLLLHMDGANNSTSFIDDSGNNLTVTANGAVIGTAQSKFGGSSGFFNGSTAHLRLPQSFAFDFVGGDFTIETFLYLANRNINQVLWSQRDNVSALNMLVIRVGSNNKVQVYYGATAGTLAVESNSTVPLSTWVHVAVTKQGNFFKIWYNGSLDGTSASIVTSFERGRTVTIGKDNYYNSEYLSGYLDEFRVTRGLAVYTANFTPTSAAFSNNTANNPVDEDSVDPYFANVALLMRMNGTQGSTIFTDSSSYNHSITRYGDAQISNNYYKFGSSSGLFSGSNSYLSVAQSYVLDLAGSVPFTIEFFYLPITFNNSKGVALVNQGFSGYMQFRIERELGANVSVLMGNDNLTNWQIQWSVNCLTDYIWTHIALVSDGGTVRLYIDGVLRQSATAPRWTSSARAINVMNGPGGVGYGHIDDLRITKGVARYSSNFLPPSVPHPISQGTSAYADPYYNSVTLLLEMTGADGLTVFPDTSLYQRKVFTNGNTVMTLSQSKFGSTSVYFDGTGDYLTTTPSTQLYFGGDFTIELWFYVSTYKDCVLLSSASSEQSNIQIFRLNRTGNGSIDVYMDNNEANAGFLFPLPAGQFTTGTWNHIAMTRAGIEGKLFLNGTLKATILNWPTGFRADVLGCLFNSGTRNTTLDFVGFIDGVRFTKGVSRYTLNAYNVPTSQFPSGGVTIVDSNFNNVSLLLHMDGSNGSTSFPDAGPNGFTVTSSGNASISTTYGRFGDASGYFDGSGDYLSVVPASAHYYTGDFTLELWFMQLSYVDGVLVSSANSDQNNVQIFRLNYGSNGSIGVYISNNEGDQGWVLGPVPASFTTGIWNHLAISRTGSTTYLFVNGVALASNIGWTAGFRADVIGGLFNSGSKVNSLDYQGYVDEVRFTKGVGRYNDNFVLPANAFSDYEPDPFFTSVSLLMHMDGSNNSTTFTDSSYGNRTPAAGGSVKISTDQSKFGGSSGLFNGTRSNVTVSGAGNFGTGDFTVEMWVRPNTASTQSYGRFIQCGDFNSGGDWQLVRNSLSGNTNPMTPMLDFLGGSFRLTTATTLADNTWSHLAISRQSGVVRMFINGTQVASGTSNANLTQSTITVGATSTISENYAGYIDEVRITRGVARYTGNFSVPTKAFPSA